MCQRYVKWAAASRRVGEDACRFKCNSLFCVSCFVCSGIKRIIVTYCTFFINMPWIIDKSLLMWALMQSQLIFVTWSMYKMKHVLILAAVDHFCWLKQMKVVRLFIRLAGRLWGKIVALSGGGCNCCTSFALIYRHVWAHLWHRGSVYSSGIQPQNLTNNHASGSRCSQLRHFLFLNAQAQAYWNYYLHYNTKAHTYACRLRKKHQ